MKTRNLLVSLIVVLAIGSAPGVAKAATYALHVGGICSQYFTQGGGRLGNWPGITSVDLVVDQRTSMVTASSQLKSKLDLYCTGGNNCYIFAYSNGGAVVSKTLATYDVNYNIVWVGNAASNEGGSELSGSQIQALLGGLTSTDCPLASNISPTDQRGGWTHDDTNGTILYMTAGEVAAYQSLIALWPFVLGENDGVVGFHSAGGKAQDEATSNVCTGVHYTNHVVPWACDGFYAKDHFGMKMLYILRAGG